MMADMAPGIMKIRYSDAPSRTPVTVKVRPVKTCPRSLAFAVTDEKRSAGLEALVKVVALPVAVRLGVLTVRVVVTMVAKRVSGKSRPDRFCRTLAVSLPAVGSV
ncbi:hypothetical protein [Azospirillum brasilense]|uniref:hypothetical protein n=1 Tax=Azospirillum brasilense TaxID=192 RepID=UPI001FEB4103|nr:hypothetical protein [Azospirillum brasilense]